MERTLMTINEISNRYGMHPRTASSRLEREKYEGFYHGQFLCFYIDDRADAILKRPVRHTHRSRRRLLEQQVLPLGIEPENKTENPQDGREFGIGEKVAVALVAELPDVNITINA